MRGTSVRTKGRISTWNDEKGYGFVTPLGGGPRIFIHAKAFANRNRRPEVDDVVTYSISQDKQGRACAANAALAGDKLRERRARRPSRNGILFAAAFLGAVGIAVAAGNLPVIVAIAYAGMSLIAFIAYVRDKSAAQSGAWRTAEGTLLALGLVGGWPGALIAQEMLRHKSKKTSFRVRFWFTVLVNAVVLGWLFTAQGKAALQGLLA